jgi:hypothetical protein
MGIADYQNPANLSVILKIATDDPTDFQYYVNFNRKPGINSESETGGDKLMLTRRLFRVSPAPVTPAPAPFTPTPAPVTLIDAGTIADVSHVFSHNSAGVWQRDLSRAVTLS